MSRTAAGRTPSARISRTMNAELATIRVTSADTILRQSQR
jgi:hypothetical protein